MINVTAEVRTPSDDELVSRVQQGDKVAFGELYYRHRPNCMKLAISILHNLSDAEDEVQQAFTNAYRHIWRLRNNGQFSTWLNRIVINFCVMRIRSANRRRLARLDDILVDGRCRELADHAPSPESAFREAELQTDLRAEIRGMPSVLRTVLQLRYLEDRSTDEVANMMGITVAAVKSRSQRARVELKRRLSAYI